MICKWVGNSEIIAGKHDIVLSDENLGGASTWAFDEVKRKVKWQSSALAGRGELEEAENSLFSELFAPLPASARTPSTPTGI